MHKFLKFIFVIKLHMFRTHQESSTVHAAMVYVILKFHKWVNLLVHIRAHCI